MFDDHEARKKLFRDMGDFASQEGAAQLKQKYGPREPAVEDVPGTEEDAEDSAIAEPQEGETGAEGGSLKEMLMQLSEDELRQMLGME